MIVLGQHLFPRLNRGGALQMVVLVLGFSEHLGLLVLHVDVGLRGKCDETRNTNGSRIRSQSVRRERRYAVMVDRYMTDLQRMKTSAGKSLDR